jgi:hypothetical protein
MDGGHTAEWVAVMSDLKLACGAIALFFLMLMGVAYKVAVWNQCRAIGGPVAYCWQVVSK